MENVHSIMSTLDNFCHMKALCCSRCRRDVKSYVSEKQRDAKYCDDDKETQNIASLRRMRICNTWVET